MQNIKQFRCPFEVKGRQESTIIEVVLGEDKAERLAAIRAAYQDLRASTTKSIAIRLTLPDSFQGKCSSNEELYHEILPYQAEVTAADLDMMLEPLLSYQQERRSKYLIGVAMRSDPLKALAAIGLNELLQVDSPSNVAELCDWIKNVIRRTRRLRPDDPTIVVKVRHESEMLPVLAFEAAAVRLFIPLEKSGDGLVNTNLISIVKSPFYPEAFGRYGEKIEIVVTREADIAALSYDTRINIMSRANAVHMAHGVPIADPARTAQPIGVWIPEFK